MGRISLETRDSQVELSLEKINSAFEEFTTFYSNLLEKGVEETEYGTVFNEIAQNFRQIYATSKSNSDALLLNKQEFSVGNLERAAYERSLVRIEQTILGTEFDLRLKIVPKLKKAEKEFLQQQIEIVEKIDAPPEIKTELRSEAQQIQTTIVATEKQPPIDQLKGYISIGQKINSLGQKIWKYAGIAAKGALPIAIPAIIRVLGTP
jgi:hypothetical protein